MAREFSFPVIRHISQIRENIEGCSHFIIKQKDEYFYATYKRVSSDTFLPMFRYNPPLELTDEEYNHRNLRREVRGLVFDVETGEIVSRSVHKFFNVNEREEASVRRIDEILSELKHKDDTTPVFHVLEKLDGSLVTPIMETVDKNTKRLRWRTKLGFAQPLSRAIEKLVYGEKEVNEYPLYNVEKGQDCQFVATPVDSSVISPLQNYLDFCIKWMSQGYTPLFEFFDIEHKVIIEYKQPFLSLIALRNTITGEYIPYETMKAEAEQFNMQYVKEYPVNINMNAKSITTELLRAVDEMEKGNEGFVIRLRNGDMYKMKSKWYSDIHRCRELILLGNMREGHIWKLVLDNQIDDMLPVLPDDEYRQRLTTFNDKLVDAIERTIKCLEDDCQEAKRAATKDKLDLKVLSEWVDEKLAHRHGLHQNIVKVAVRMETAPEPKSVEDVFLSVIQNKVMKDLPQCRGLLNEPDLAYEFVERQRWGHKKNNTEDTSKESFDDVDE